MPISRHVRIILKAISPRLAINIFLNTATSLKLKALQFSKKPKSGMIPPFGFLMHFFYKDK
jgi:hypothetical protein